MFFLSPLEHFQVYPLISIYFLNYDYSITNETIILLLFLILISIYFLSFLKNSENSFYIVPNNRWQVLNELLFLGLLSVISENIRHKLGQKFFPLIFFIFIFIFGLNVIGLVPFSFALTGHLIVTMFISLSVFFAINIMGCRIHGHVLIKVILGFVYVLMGAGGFLFVLHYIPLLILLPLFVLELFVVVIQSLVFCLLVCIYINDCLNLH